MFFTPREWLQLIGVGSVLLLVLGLPIWLLLRAGKRMRQRQLDEVFERPLVRYPVDVGLMTLFRDWQIARLGANNRLMGRRMVKIAAWILSILMLGFGILGAVRDRLLDGVLIGAMIAGIILGCAGGAVAVIAWLNRRGQARLRALKPAAAEVYLGAGGIYIDPMLFQPLYGELHRISWYNEQPTVLEFATRRSNGKGGWHWTYLHAPVPADWTQRVHEALAPLRAHAPGNQPG